MSILAALLFIPGNQSHSIIESDSFASILIVGAVFAVVPSWFIGIRLWITSDARRIWENPEAIVVTVLAAASSASADTQLARGFSPTKYWQKFWTVYWSEREIALGQFTLTRQRVWRQERPVARSMELETVMNRSRQWYELLIAAVGILALAIAFSMVAVRL